MIRFVLVVVLGSGLAVSPAVSATYLVAPDSTGDFVDIAAAIAGTADGDVIELTDGIFTGDGNRNVFIGSWIRTIRSQSGDAAACILDPDGGPGLAQRAFAFQGAGSMFVLENLTFRNGSALSVAESYGGALYLGNNSSPTITGCIFENNQADRGGAIFLFNNCSPSISDCTFIGNAAVDYGGALSFTTDCAPAISNCLFRGNAAGANGGALNVWNGAAPTITNCTFYGNSAPGGGAAAWCRWGGAPVFVNTIIASSAVGDAVGCDPGSVSTPTFACCDVYGNAGGDWVDCLTGLDASNGNSSGDPLFCDAANGDFRLQDNSPCLDVNSTCGQVGMVGLGTCLSSAVQHSSWGSIKALYR